MPGTLKREDQINDRYDDEFNRRNLRSQEQAAGEAYAQAGIDQAEAFANDPSNASANTEQADKAENEFGYKNSSDSDGGGRTGSGFISFTKKKGPMATIVGLLVGGGGLMTFVLSPAALPVTLMEHFSNDLNDTTSWNYHKVSNLFGKKLGKLQKKVGYCGRHVTLRCKYSTMSSYQAGNFEKAGITLDSKTTKGIAGGRVAFSSMTFVDPDTGAEHTAKNPAELNKLLRENAAVRSQLYHAFNPNTGWFFGNRFTNLLGKMGLSKAKKIKGDNKEETDSSYKQSNSDDTEDSNNTNLSADEEEGDDDKTKSDNEKNEKFVKDLKSSLDENGKRLKLGGGAVGMARAVCAVYTVSSLVNTAAKVIKAERLAKFAMIFLTGAASIKAGDATAAEVQKMADILVPSKYPSKVVDPDTGDMMKNPNIGKNALDSEAFKIVAYGDKGNLSKIAQRFMVGGGFSGKLNSLVGSINSHPSIKGPLKTTCKAVNSKFAGFLDLASNFLGPGGLIKKLLTTTLSVAAGPLFEKLVSAGLKYAIKLASGKDLTTDIQGVDAGNAIFAGTAVIMGKSAMSMGMKPGNSSEIVKNMADNTQVQQTYIADAQYDARKTPFDINNQYSFLGSILADLRGTAVTPTAKIQNLFATITNPLKLAVPSAHAGGFIMSTANYTEDRFKDCADPVYKDMGIDADEFCNVRYVPFKELDSDDVLDYMINHNVIDDEGNVQSSSQGDDYQKWVQGCTDARQAPWGDDEEGAGKYTDGRECMKNTDSNINYANFYAYQGANSDMDDEPTQYSAESGSPFDFVVGSYNLLNTDAWGAKSAQIGGCTTAALKKSDPKCIKTRSAIDAKIITGQAGNPAMDIVGTQETSADQFRAVKGDLTGYDAIPSNEADIKKLNNRTDGATAVFWNTSKFTKVGEGKMNNLSNTSKPITEPWVQLKTSGGQTLFVLSIHYANSGYGGTAANIKKSANLTMDWVKSKVGQGTVIVMGDFNDTLKQKLAYCVYTKDSVLQHAADMAAGADPSAGCSNPRAPGIDHIYASPGGGLTSSGWTHMKREGLVAHGSDHEPVYVTYHFPGGEGNPVPYKNPVYNGSAPDPGVIRGDDGTYHVYATGEVHLTSKDLVHWKKAKNGWNLTGGGHYACMWAPDVAKVGSSYVLTYAGMSSCGSSGGVSATSAIRYAVGSSAAGPFKYKGTIATEGYTIDPHIFVDDDGKTWLEFGGGNLYIVQVKLEGSTLKRVGSAKKIFSKTSTPTIENGWIQKKNGWYYLFYSQGHWNKSDGDPEYSTKIARSKKVTGPYKPTTYKTILSGGGGAFWGPGGGSITTDDGGNDWFVYHDWYKGNRVLMIDPITYGSDGWPTIGNGHPSTTSVSAGPMIGGAAASKSTSGSSGDLAWPVAQKWWTKDKNDFLNAHGLSSGTFTSPYIKGWSTDISSPPAGTPIYSMLAGKVIESDSCKVMVQTPVTGGNLQIAYGHGTNRKVKAGDQVKAGQQLASEGQNCNATGPHVHIDMALDRKHICPQDVFIAMSRGKTPNWQALARKYNGKPTGCGRV